MPVIPAPSTPLLRIQLNQSINPHDGDASLDRALQLADLAHAGFQHPGTDLVHDFPARQIESVVFVVSAFCGDYAFVGGFSVLGGGSDVGVGLFGGGFRGGG